jgi:hypothetical protein
VGRWLCPPACLPASLGRLVSAPGTCDPGLWHRFDEFCLYDSAFLYVLYLHHEPLFLVPLLGCALRRSVRQHLGGQVDKCVGVVERINCCVLPLTVWGYEGGTVGGFALELCVLLHLGPLALSRRRSFRPNLCVCRGTAIEGHTLMGGATAYVCTNTCVPGCSCEHLARSHCMCCRCAVVRRMWRQRACPSALVGRASSGMPTPLYVYLWCTVHFPTRCVCASCPVAYGRLVSVSQKLLHGL